MQTPSASGKWAESAGGGGKRRRVRPPPHGPGTAALGNGKTSFRTHEALVRCMLADTLLDHPHLAPCRGLDQSRSQPTATWNTALPEWERSLLKVFVKAVPSPLTSRDKLIKLRATGKCYLAMPLPWAAARCRVCTATASSTRSSCCPARPCGPGLSSGAYLTSLNLYFHIGEMG